VDRIDNATNINWYDADFATKVGKLDKSKPVFVYCKAGSRSAQAAGKLSELGFKEIYSLEGGIMKWNAANSNKASGKIVGMCDQEFGELIKSSDKVMIDFNAKWCAPCQKMKPYVAKLEEEMKDKVKIVSLDADENRTLTEQLKIDGLPTIIIYEKGKEVWRNVGYISEEDLKKHL
jgi:thioredoxin